MDITQRLQQCVIEPQQKTKIDAFTQVLGDVLASSEVGPAQVQNLKEYVQCVLDEQVGLVVARQLLSDFISLFNERIQDTQVKKQVLTYAIDLAQPRSVSFEEQLSQLRENLAKVYEEEEEYLSFFFFDTHNTRLFYFMATNNSLLQFARVITDHHYDPSPPSPQRARSESSPHPTLRSGNSRLDHRHSFLPIRKNACVVCGICFTCSNTYGMNCRCEEMQPRRGRNLPEGSLDSRAKKLHPRDKEDYAFSIEWLSLHAHPMHKNSTGQVIGLRNLPEVSLCKAHSSTLYRAKKRHERSKASCSPTATTTPTTPTATNTSSSNNDTTTNKIPEGGIGGLAAKVREIMNQQQYPAPPPPPPSDLSIQASTSLKRKRPSPPVHSSASTPLYATAPPMLRHSAPCSSYSHQLPPLQQQQQQQEPASQQHQHARTPSLSSLSSSLQEQLRLSPLRVQSVSLKAITSNNPLDPPQYYVRNLAINDTFTFRDLLKEVDMKGPPPPGKRIVIIDDKTDTLYPLDQAIRNVIKRPSSAHIELSLALTEKTAIDWSTYT